MLFSDLSERVAQVRGRIAEAAVRGGHGQAVEIVAVTKTHGAGAVEAAWGVGITDVGENRVQEALEKIAAVSVPVRWHLIGHLQRNKVKHLDAFVLLHAMDSARLADAVHAHGVRRGRAVDALLQVNASGEGTKGGYATADVRAEAERLATPAGSGVRMRGVMTMAPFGAAEGVLRRTFAAAREACDTLREAGHPAEYLSMGMSEDYLIAVEEGATHVRLGTILFGARA